MHLELTVLFSADLDGPAQPGIWEKHIVIMSTKYGYLYRARIHSSWRSAYVRRLGFEGVRD